MGFKLIFGDYRYMGTKLLCMGTKLIINCLPPRALTVETVLGNVSTVEPEMNLPPERRTTVGP